MKKVLLFFKKSMPILGPKRITKAVFFSFIGVLLTVGSVNAQTTTIGFSGTVAAGSAPSGNGPSNTAKTVTLHQGQAVASPPGAAFTPTTAVTFSLSNQQFASIEGNSTTTGMEFGALGNAGVGSAGNNVLGTPLWAGLGTIFGGTYVGNYTGCNSCTVGNSSTTATGDGVRYTELAPKIRTPVYK